MVYIKNVYGGKSRLPTYRVVRPKNFPNNFQPEKLPARASGANGGAFFCGKKCARPGFPGRRASQAFGGGFFVRSFRWKNKKQRQPGLL
ncbi:MAG: hypothetical protein D6714_18495 [Bacteroidetes bacterium]|nr:MAG: hypothetical protein D6714_18495 [Bacteroidota bacterium]